MHGAIFSLGITIPNRVKIMYWQELLLNHKDHISFKSGANLTLGFHIKTFIFQGLKAETLIQYIASLRRITASATETVITFL
jgi:hypothetical protein